MITRLYVDNYKCMVNFEYRPERMQLLFGPNGHGKTASFEIIHFLKQLVVQGALVSDKIRANTKTAWDTRMEQTFELDVQAKDGTYTYKLRIQHDPSKNKCRITNEELCFDANRLYWYDGENAHLFHDDFSEGPTYPFDSSRSAISSIPERPDFQRLTWFRKRMAAVSVFAIDPWGMTSRTEGEHDTPDLRLHNLASWYRHLSQEEPQRSAKLFDSLGAVIDGFASLSLRQAGETTRILWANFRELAGEGGTTSDYSLRLIDLSEGQMCLIALFTILHFGIRPDTTVCIDEPDSFVALRELQPWLLELSDRVADVGGQCLLISHHPEFLNRLAVRQGAHFVRENGGPVRVKPLEWPADGALTPAEIVARGWEQ